MALLEEHGATEWPQLLSLKADALLCCNDPEQALEACSAALRVVSDRATNHSNIASEALLRNNLASLLVAAGRLAEAEVELLRCIELAPSDLVPVYNLTLMLWQAGEKERASQHWLRFRKYPHCGTKEELCEGLATQVSNAAPPN